MEDCCRGKSRKEKSFSVREKSVFYGSFSGLGLIAFYLGVVSLFQGFSFALMNLRSLWYLIFPLAIGFGIQIGLFVSIRHHARLAGTVTTTGAISGGSMIVCCSHFLFNMIPFAGFSGVAVFLSEYQPWFLVLGIVSNIFGIIFLIKHKNKMQKGGSYHNE